jgi:hypothetical protein
VQEQVQVQVQVQRVRVRQMRVQQVAAVQPSLTLRTP